MGSDEFMADDAKRRYGAIMDSHKMWKASSTRSHSAYLEHREVSEALLIVRHSDEAEPLLSRLGKQHYIHKLIS